MKFSASSRPSSEVVSRPSRPPASELAVMSSQLPATLMGTPVVSLSSRGELMADSSTRLCRLVIRPTSLHARG